MTNRFKRYFDYVSAAQTLPANSGVVDIAIQTNLDAPFVLRSRAMRMQYRPGGVSNPGQQLLLNVLAQFANADGKYYQNQLLPFFLETTFNGQSPNFGQWPNGVWVPDAIVYPAGATIWAQVQNTGSSAIPGFQVFFRGYQLFKCGQVPDLTYPSPMSVNAFSYVIGTLEQPLSLPAQMGAPLTNVKIPGNRLGGGQQNTDADFVARTARSFFPSNPHNIAGAVYPCEVFARLRDWNDKAYSNDLIHVDVLFGNTSIGPAGSNTNPGAGIAQPGLFTPEIYVPANQYLQLDLLRQDGYLTSTFGQTTQAENITIGFKGSKVYRARARQ